MMKILTSIHNIKYTSEFWGTLVFGGMVTLRFLFIMADRLPARALIALWHYGYDEEGKWAGMAALSMGTLVILSVQSALNVAVTLSILTKPMIHINLPCVLFCCRSWRKIRTGMDSACLRWWLQARTPTSQRHWCLMLCLKHSRYVIDTEQREKTYSRATQLSALSANPGLSDVWIGPQATLAQMTNEIKLDLLHIILKQRTWSTFHLWILLKCNFESFSVIQISLIHV